MGLKGKVLIGYTKVIGIIFSDSAKVYFSIYSPMKFENYC